MGYLIRQRVHLRTSSICPHKVRVTALMTYMSKRPTPISHRCQDVSSLRTYTSEEILLVVYNIRAACSRL